MAYSFRKNGFIQRFRLILLFVFCFASLFAQAEASGGCKPKFSYKDGGWGGDAAYSIPLRDGRSVWIFGDTLYGDKRVVEGNEPRMVRNSIGISRCSANKEFDVQYVIRHGQDGSPQDFFKAQTKGTWYWALDGFTNGKDLWITLLCIRNPRVKRPDGFDFETCGADLARVSDLDADPQNWKVSYFPLVPDGVAAYPSATTVVEGDYVYLFALYEKGTRPMVVTRIPLAGLVTPAASLQYLAKDASWKSGLRPEDAMEVMPHGATEMTIRYHASLKQWLAVMKSPDVSSDAILLRTADHLTGPWSSGEVIYRIPEMQKNSPEYDKNVFCYAGKEHPEFDSSGLVITYVCNTMKVPDLVRNLKIYIPKIVWVPLADVARSEGASSK